MFTNELITLLCVYLGNSQSCYSSENIFLCLRDQCETAAFDMFLCFYLGLKKGFADESDSSMADSSDSDDDDHKSKPIIRYNGGGGIIVVDQFKSHPPPPPSVSPRYASFLSYLSCWCCCMIQESRNVSRHTCSMFLQIIVSIRFENGVASFSGYWLVKLHLAYS